MIHWKTFFLGFVFCLLLFPKIHAQTTKDPNDDAENKVDLLLEMFLEYEYSDTQLARSYLNEALKLSTNNHYQEGLATTYQYIGYFMEDAGNYSEAHDNYQRFLSITKNIKDSLRIADAYNNIGNIYLFQGNYLKAIENYEIALAIGESKKDTNLLSKCVNNLGISYFYLRKDTVALEYYQKSIEMAKALSDITRMAASLDNMGLIYQRQKKYDQALASHKQSMAIREELNDKFGIASCYHNIGVNYAGKSDSIHQFFDEALKNYKIALKMYLSLGNKGELPKCYYNIALLFYKKKDIDKAIEYGEKALDYGKEMGMLENMKLTYSLLSDCYKEKEDYKNAYEKYVNYKQTYDSLINAEKIKELAQLEMKYRFDKLQKEKEFEQKRKDILKEEEIKRQKVMRNFLSVGIAILLLLMFFIYRSYRIKRKDNKLLAYQKMEIETKNAEITSSIKYAKRIQEAILPPDKHFFNIAKDSFILYKPKDIVSGDFYWIERIDNKIYLAAVDCTGHGVPGAIISVIGYNGLNRAVNEFKLRKPSEILDKLNEIVNKTLRQTYEDSAIRDGMDIALCSIDKTKCISYLRNLSNFIMPVRRHNF
ncbi:MAG: hypothetical protein C0594_11620 [Marinilabiliales bacterium]|nr:MAG: hypothetical protein C0594_11620 [Marinilabiliales bacterium]